MQAANLINTTIFSLFFALLLVTSFHCNAVAQSVEASDTNSVDTIFEFYHRYKIRAGQPGIHEYAFWGGYSFHSSSGIWGQTSGAKLGVMGLRYNRKFMDIPPHYLLKYVVEMNLFVHYELTQINDSFSSTPPSISGFGMTPVGLQLNWTKSPWIQPFFKSSTGFMQLTEPFPDSRGTQFNFTLEIGIGAEIKVGANAFFTIGYKYHHMSNGRFGQINPGVDSNVFYGGLTLF